MFLEKLEKLCKYLLFSVTLYPKIELITVMVVIPFITTCLQVFKLLI